MNNTIQLKAGEIMINRINIQKALSIKDAVMIDVRSPKEFEEDTIPDAINIPILSDEERERVGYLYKQVGREKAKELGLQYASYKLVDFYKEIKSIIYNKKVPVLFCYRGGMRSSSVATIMDIMGLYVHVLEGGYKSYRSYVMDNLPCFAEKFNFIVLHGYTGVGKTKLLDALINKNMQVIDIEGLAKNSGSVFGSLAYRSNSNSQKAFESLLLRAYQSFESSIVFTESESKRVGRVILPDFMFNDMVNGYHVLIKTSMKNRINNIMEDYIDVDIPDRNNRIIEAISKLRKRLGNDKVNELIGEVNAGDYYSAIETLMVDYYDPLYEYSIKKVEQYDLIIEYEDKNLAVNELIKFADKCSK